MMWAHEQLSYDQERSLLSQALEVYAERPDQRDPEDEVFEIVASWAPVMNRDVREQWVEAGCPEPSEEFGGLGQAANIHEAMKVAVEGVAYDFLFGFIQQADTHLEAAQVIDAELRLTQQERIDRIMAS